MNRLRILLMVLVVLSLSVCMQAALVDYYQFENNLTDSAGRMDGSERGTTMTYVAGPSGFGQALSFNGTDNYVVIGADSTVLNGNQMTLALWMYDNQPSTVDHFPGLITRAWNTTDLNDWTFRRYNFDSYSIYDTAQFGIGPSYSATATTMTEASLSGQWVHLAVTYDSGEVTYYVNGVAAGGYTDASTTLTTTWAAIVLGLDKTQDRFFNGAMDEVRIYDNALSASEVAALIPEPATMTLMLAGGIGFFVRRKK